MSITNGQQVRAETDNAAFMSRTSNTSTVGQVDLLKPTGSGATVTDVQQTVNDMKDDINTNASNIAANTADIATNTADIATNAANITTVQNNLTSHELLSSSTHGLGGGDGSVVGTSATQTLTNKSIDADSNTIINIDNNEIKASAGIDVSKLADGSMSNTEFQYLSTVTSNVQDQLNAKIPSSEKGAANGVATLDATSKVPSTQLPAIAITDVYVVATIAARDALTVEEGDVAKVLDDGSGNVATYIYDGSSWVLLESDASLAAHEALTAAHGATGAVVGTTNTQALTNKDLDDVSNTFPDFAVGGDLSGTISSANVSKIQTYQVHNAAPSDGDALIWNATNSRYEPQPAGSGSGGTIINGTYTETTQPNFRLNASGPEIQQGTTNPIVTGVTAPDTSVYLKTDTAGYFLRRPGSNTTDWVDTRGLAVPALNYFQDPINMNGCDNWATYDDGAGASAPVDGTGGSPTQVLITDQQISAAVFSGANRGNKQLFTNTNGQGEGFSLQFTVSNTHKSKTLLLRYDYRAAFTAADDIVPYVYDVTNASFLTLIGQTSIPLGTTNGIAEIYFSVPSNCSAVRVIFHVATNNLAQINVSNLYLGSNPFYPNSYLSASSSAITPGSSGIWVTTSTFVTLTPGEWNLNGTIAYRAAGSVGLQRADIGWYTADGANSAVRPAFSGPILQAGVQIIVADFSTINEFDLNLPPVRVRVSGNTSIYAVPYFGGTTPANARLYSFIYARKVL